MFKEFFENLGNEMIKSCRVPRGKQDRDAHKGPRKQKSGEKAAAGVPYDSERMRELLAALVPAHLKLDSVDTIDSSGHSPEKVDYLVYREYFRNMGAMMKAVPSDLVYGAFFISPSITAASLSDTLSRVANLKKIDRFGEQAEANPFIPSFIVAMDMNMSYQDLKNLILDYYVSRSLDNYFEFDIMAIVNRGLVIKDWREKRSFKILDTAEDTMKWFFILLNEYLEVERGEALDLRRYVSDTVQYREY